MFQIRFPEQKHWISSNLHILSHFKLELVDMCIPKVSKLILLFQHLSSMTVSQIIPLGLIGTQFNFPTWFDSSTSVILRWHCHSASIVSVFGISKKWEKWHSCLSGSTGKFLYKLCKCVWWPPVGEYYVRTNVIRWVSLKSLGSLILGHCKPALVKDCKRWRYLDLDRRPLE